MNQLFDHPADYYVLAQQENDSFVSSSLLRFEDETSSHFTINTGETVILKGNIQSLVSQDMKVSVDMKLNAMEGTDWVLVNKTPSDAFALPAAESVPYEFVLKILSPGTFPVQLDAKILEIPNRAVSIDASSLDCSGCRITAATVDVIAPVSLSLVAMAGVVIAAGGAISIWYLRRRSKQKSVP